MSMLTLKDRENVTIGKWTWLLVIFVVCVSDDSLFFGTHSNESITLLKEVLVIALAIILGIFCVGAKKHRKKDVMLLLVFIGLIVCSMIINGDVRVGYFYKIITILCCYFISMIVPIEVFARIYNKVLLLLSIISLILFCSEIIAPAFVDMLPKITNSSDVEFNTIFLANTPVYSGGVIRNYGFFREPGVFQMFLCIAILFQIYVIKDRTLGIYTIYVLAILSTRSTTGYIALVVLVFMLLFANKNLSMTKKIAVSGVLAITFVILLTSTDLFSMDESKQYVSVFGKLGNLKRPTTIARLASVTVNFRMLLEKPLFGQGITSVEELFEVYALQIHDIATRHNTNYLMVQFALHGLIYGGLWSYMWYRFAGIVCKSHRWVVLLFLAILFIGENMTYSLFFSLLWMYGLRGSVSGSSKNIGERY